MTTPAKPATPANSEKPNVVEQILTKIETNIENVITLNVQTLIGNMSTDANGNAIFDDNQNINGMISDINLLDGDIKTEITPTFYKSYPDLIKFHEAKVVDGQQIIKANIEVLKTIVDTLSEFFPLKPKA